MQLSERITAGLAKTRNKLQMLLKSSQGGNLQEQLEEVLLLADVGPKTTTEIIEKISAAGQLDMEMLRDQLVATLSRHQPPILKGPVILVGPNGSGKTTTVAKLGHLLSRQGKKVFVIGADTFRAAADSQLEKWCKRLELNHFIGSRGADPASVVYDGLQSTAARQADVVLCDTAGRLQSNVNLMRELEKIVRVARKCWDGNITVLMVLDGGTGQSALEQVKIYRQFVCPEGLIVTKLDGTAKGGVVVALAAELGMPVCYLGVGEGADDLVPFDPEIFVNSILKEG